MHNFNSNKKMKCVSVCVYSVDHGGEKRITAGLNKYACSLTLDPNTVNSELVLSEENREVTHVEEEQPYPDHPDRFDHHPQVLCRERVCGRCYWEVDWSRSVSLSVSYESIRRKGDGDECWFGSNDQSWSLFCRPFSFSFRHNNIESRLSVRPISRRIGVYVDPSAGTLSFYNIYRDTMSLIHSVQTTFTQTLCAGFYISPGSSLKLC